MIVKLNKQLILENYDANRLNQLALSGEDPRSIALTGATLTGAGAFDSKINNKLVQQRLNNMETDLPINNPASLAMKNNLADKFNEKINNSISNKELQSNDVADIGKYLTDSGVYNNSISVDNTLKILNDD